MHSSSSLPSPVISISYLPSLFFSPSHWRSFIGGPLVDSLESPLYYFAMIGYSSLPYFQPPFTCSFDPAFGFVQFFSFGSWGGQSHLECYIWKYPKQENAQESKERTRKRAKSPSFLLGLEFVLRCLKMGQLLLFCSNIGLYSLRFCIFFCWWITP